MTVPDWLFCFSGRVKTVTKGPPARSHPTPQKTRRWLRVDGCSAPACRQRAGQWNSAAGAMIKLMA